MKDKRKKTEDKKGGRRQTNKLDKKQTYKTKQKREEEKGL